MVIIEDFGINIAKIGNKKNRIMYQNLNKIELEIGLKFDDNNNKRKKN